MFHLKSQQLTFPVAIHTKSPQLPFNSCWNVCALQNLLFNTNQFTCHCINSFYSPDTIPDKFLLLHPLQTPHIAGTPSITELPPTWQVNKYPHRTEHGTSACVFMLIYAYILPGNLFAAH